MNVDQVPTVSNRFQSAAAQRLDSPREVLHSTASEVHIHIWFVIDFEFCLREEIIVCKGQFTEDLVRCSREQSKQTSSDIRTEN